MAPPGVPYVIVSGNIGAGKTTVVTGLSRDLNWPAHVEDPAANPFLERFYADRRRWALTSQLWFLLDSLEQQRRLASGGGLQDQSAPESVAIYGRVLRDAGAMDGTELALLEHALAAAGPWSRRPDAVLELHLPVTLLLRRIRRRGRTYEQGLTEDYLEALEVARADFFARWDLCPVIPVDAAALDVRAAEDRKHIIRALEQAIPSLRDRPAP